MNKDKRKTMIVANWKEHENVSQASTLTARLHKHIKGHRDIEVVLAPNMLALQPMSLQIDRRRFRLASQNANAKDEGALTGEVSFAMLRGIVHYGMVGHSERRIFFNESLDDVRDKVAAAIRNEIIPILCVGETADERHAGETRQVLHDQVTTALSNLTAEEVENMVIAYEPVWALSNFGGEFAKPDDVRNAMVFIRKQVSELYGPEAAKGIRILYGGSVDDHLAGGYLDIDECGGVLVGSASLNYRKFIGIVDAAYRRNRDMDK
jgi:triosephosphate isomerase (TIM)